MKYRMTEKAKQTRQTVNESIIDGLKNNINENIFNRNISYLNQGTFYNPISQTPLNDKKVMDILAQASNEKTFTDPRFITFDQAKAHGLHIKEGEKAIATVNFTIEQPKGQNEKVLVGRTIQYFNASQVEGMEALGEPMGKYTPIEQLKLMNNLENRVFETYKSQTAKFEKAKKHGEQAKVPTEFLPDRIKDMTVNQEHENSPAEEKKINKMFITTTYAMRNTAEFMGLNKDLVKEFVNSNSGEKDMQEIAMRKEFREILGASLLCHEVGQIAPYDDYLMLRDTKPLGELYEKYNGPRDLDQSLGF